MVGGEGHELDMPEGGLDVHPHYGLVALEGPLPHGVSHGVRKPAIEVLPHLQVLGIEEKPAVRVGPRRSERAAGVFLTLTGDVAPLAVRPEIRPAVAGDPARLVLARENVPVAVSPTL